MCLKGEERNKKQVQPFCVSSICIEKSTQWTHESCLLPRQPWKPHRSVTVPKCSHLTDYGPLDRLLDFWPKVFFFFPPSFFNSLAATHCSGCSRCLRGQIFWFQGKYFVFDTVKWAAVTFSSLVFLCTKYIFFFLSSRVENGLFIFVQWR